MANSCKKEKWPKNGVAFTNDVIHYTLNHTNQKLSNLCSYIRVVLIRTTCNLGCCTKLSSVPFVTLPQFWNTMDVKNRLVTF